MRSMTFDATKSDGTEELRALLGGPEEVHRDHQGRFARQEPRQAPGTSDSGGQVAQPTADFDSGVRETPRHRPTRRPSTRHFSSRWSTGAPPRGRWNR